MARTASTKASRLNAEKAAVWYAYKVYHAVVHTKAVRTQWQTVDLFGADVVAKDRQGRTMYLQATAGGSSAVTKRRRKLEAIPWGDEDMVQILQLISKHNPHDARRKRFYFRIHTLTSDGWTVDKIPLPIPNTWFTRWTPDDA